LLLGRRKVVQAGKERQHKLMQGGEAQLHLRFDTYNPTQAEIGAFVNAVLE
jgi:hypothetical protein